MINPNFVLMQKIFLLDLGLVLAASFWFNRNSNPPFKDCFPIINGSYIIY